MNFPFTSLTLSSLGSCRLCLIYNFFCIVFCSRVSDVCPGTSGRKCGKFMMLASKNSHSGCIFLPWEDLRAILSATFAYHGTATIRTNTKD